MITYGSGCDLPYNSYYVHFCVDGIPWTNGQDTLLNPSCSEVGWANYDDQDNVLREILYGENAATPLLTQRNNGTEAIANRPNKSDPANHPKVMRR